MLYRESNFSKRLKSNFSKAITMGKKAITMGKKGGKQVYTNSDSEESDDEVVYGSTNNSPVMTNIQQSNAPVTSNVVSQTSSPNISVGVPTQNNSIVSTASVHIPTTILPSNIPIKGEKNAIHGHLKSKAPNTLLLTSAGLRRYIKATEILRASTNNSPVMTNIQQSNAPVTSNVVSQTSSPNISVGVPTQNNSIVSTASVHIPTLPSNIPKKGGKNAIHRHLKGKAPNTLFLTNAGLRRYIKATGILRAQADIHKYLNTFVNEILHIILKHANAYADHGRRVTIAVPDLISAAKMCGFKIYGDTSKAKAKRGISKKK
jgi:histone H3/H4